MIDTVTDLDLEALAPGTRTHLWLEIADDQVGLPIKVPVLVMKGVQPGPTAGITAAVHGDEVNGIPVIHQLFEKMDPRRVHGTIVGIPIVNVPAFRLHQRRMLEGVDLNHRFPGRADGPLGDVYAHRLLDRAIRHFDFSIDLHTASRGRANCLYVRADMSDPATAHMAYLQRPQIILHNPASDGTLRGAAAELGIPAITVEVGNSSRHQREVVRRTAVGLRSVLAQQGIIQRRKVAEAERPIVCSASEWLYTEDGGLLEVFVGLVEQVEAGQEIAQVVDAFGQPKRTYLAPHDGVVIGRSLDPVAATGARILHLGVVAEPDSGLVEHP